MGAERITELRADLARNGRKIGRLNYGLERLAMFEDALVAVKKGEKPEAWPMEDPAKFLPPEKKEPPDREDPDAKYVRMQSIDLALERTRAGFDRIDNAREVAFEGIVKISDAIEQELDIFLHANHSVASVESRASTTHISDEKIRKEIKNERAREIALRIFRAQSDDDSALRQEMIDELCGGSSQNLSNTLVIVRAFFEANGISVKEVYEKKDGTKGRPKTRGYYVAHEQQEANSAFTNRAPVLSQLLPQAAIAPVEGVAPDTVMTDLAPMVDLQGRPVTIDRFLSEESSLQRGQVERYDASGRPVFQRQDFRSLASFIDYHHSTLTMLQVYHRPMDKLDLLWEDRSQRSGRMQDIFQERVEILEALVVLQSLSPREYLDVYEAQDRHGRQMLEFFRSIRHLLPKLVGVAKKDLEMAQRFDERKAAKLAAKKASENPDQATKVEVVLES